MTRPLLLLLFYCCCWLLLFLLLLLLYVLNSWYFATYCTFVFVDKCRMRELTGLASVLRCVRNLRRPPTSKQDGLSSFPRACALHAARQTRVAAFSLDDFLDDPEALCRRRAPAILALLLARLWAAEKAEEQFRYLIVLNNRFFITMYHGSWEMKLVCKWICLKIKPKGGI